MMLNRRSFQDIVLYLGLFLEIWVHNFDSIPQFGVLVPFYQADSQEFSEETSSAGPKLTVERRRKLLERNTRKLRLSS
jgi:hypothetical protein